MTGLLLKQTLCGLRVVLWLKGKHLKSSLRKMAYVFATDIVEDKDLGERLYQLYAVGTLATALFLIWIAALDMTTKLFASLDSSLSDILLQASPLFLILIFIISGYSLLRSCLIHLQYPDITYLASSKISASTLVFANLLGQLIGYVTVFFLIFYYIGTGLQANLDYFLDPFVYSLSMTLYVLCSFSLTWIVGLLRFTSDPKKLLKNKVLGITFFIILLATFIGFFALSLFIRVGITACFFANYALSLLLPTVFFIVGFAFLLILSRRIIMLWVIEANSLFAESYPLRHMMFTNSQAYREIMRKKKLANRFMRRGARKFLNIGSGFATFITRDILSLGRQSRGIFTLVLWGAFVAPFTIVIASGIIAPLSWIMLISLLLTFPKGVWETTRIYRSDMRNQMFRPLIPYNPLSLLLRDSLPSFTVVALCSIISILILSSWGIKLLEGIVLSILLNTIFTLCSGLDEVRVFGAKMHVGYELALLISLAIFALSALIATGLSLIVISLLVSLVLSLLLRRGTALG